MNEEENVDTWKDEPTEDEMLLGFFLMGTIILALVCGTLYSIVQDFT